MNSPSNPVNPDETPPKTQNDQSNKNSNSSINDLPPIYDHQIAHTVEMKFVNDRYVTPVTAKFGSSDSDNSVNLPAKHRELFATLKLLDPSISITINDTTINHPGESPMGAAYTDIFDVINNKKQRFPRFYPSRTPLENPSLRSQIR